MDDAFLPEPEQSFLGVFAFDPIHKHDATLSRFVIEITRSQEAKEERHDPRRSLPRPDDAVRI